jgi:RNA polymerase sigma-70 factor (ECF subfamily)
MVEVAEKKLRPRSASVDAATGGWQAASIASIMAVRMWPDQDETQELLRGARQGDDNAVDRLMDRHRDSLHRMVECRLNRGLARRVDASDVVQEALLTASRRLSDYLQDPCMPFHAWLRQLARDRLADVYRRELADKRDVARDESVAAEEFSRSPFAQATDVQLTPAAELLRKEFAERFNQAVEQLDETAKEIIVMRHAEQLSNSQVAQLLDLSEPAAGMRYLRALRQLRALLGERASEWLE